MKRRRVYPPLTRTVVAPLAQIKMNNASTALTEVKQDISSAYNKSDVERAREDLTRIANQMKSAGYELLKSGASLG